jgi:aryl-alcohol dehydrogenase-like predicted oxidoreductase
MPFSPYIRMGVGTLQMAGPNAWGRASNPAEVQALLKTAISLGVRVVDTAWYYGPDKANELLAETLWPYPSDLMIVGKIGNSRNPVTHEYEPKVSSEELHTSCTRSLRTLRIESFPLLLLRWRADLSHAGQFDEAWGTMLDLQQQGKAVDIGLSNVDGSHVNRAQREGSIAAISNAYSLMDRSEDYMVQYCHWHNIWFIPYYPLNRGSVQYSQGLTTLARELGVEPVQVALAWLMARSPKVIPIPGTSRLEHLLENLAAVDLKLTEEQLVALSGRP